ncbi:MAG: hypothetical protein NC253_05350 [Ruminococcus sp.]|nr:hypothetical protein [Ruminococcus sp.]MCM1381797.1 hypothetical protein [Muribaculaceae bacterium]MCM1478255.1 hypothetical protein [Muribaculaceae bacterium]
MKKIDWKRKLSSRKFWAAVSGVVISVMIIFGADSGSQEKIAGAITSAGVLVTYILAESGTDKAALENEDKEE